MTEPQTWQRGSPYFTTLGLSLLEAGEGHARVALPLTPAVANRKGDVHGGAIASLIDMAMSQAIRSGLTEYRGLATISMSVNYLAVGGGELIAEAVVIRTGRSTAFAVAEVRDGAGQVVATGQGAFRVIR